jgi:hypothetical protein
MPFLHSPAANFIGNPLLPKLYLALMTPGTRPLYIPLAMGPEQPDTSAERRLSPQAAFVVQFVSGSRLDGGSVGGRVEHVASGRSARFDSIEQLLRFLGEVLAQQRKETD